MSHRSTTNLERIRQNRKHILSGAKVIIPSTGFVQSLVDFHLIAGMLKELKVRRYQEEGKWFVEIEVGA